MCTLARKAMKLFLCSFTFVYLFFTSEAQNDDLDFLTLSFSSTLTRSDDAESSSIYTDGAFPFGSSSVSYVYVNSNGYISMGISQSETSPTIPTNTDIVSPYGADIDTSIAGTVSYSSFYDTTSTQKSTVSSFIRSQTGSSFYGTRMMIAEWDGVAKYRGSSFTTTTFQAVLITDGSDSYAVFIYECGGIGWGGATIGWSYSSSIYEEHSLSGSSSASIGTCLDFSSNYRTVVYRLTDSGTGSSALDFLTLSSTTTITRSDDARSSAIYTNGGFPFGSSSVSYVYVSSNGYISMGTSPSDNSPTIPSTTDIVSPYGADIDTSIAGTVSYSSFSSTTTSQMNTVSSLIRSQTDSSFYGTRMMIAQWDGVAKYSGSSLTTSTFQAVLITDGSDSYAVFIYECGGMEWGGATIGWAYSSSIYEEHSLSGSSSASIGTCQDSSSNYRTVVYKLTGNCGSSMFTCDNGDCEPESFVCDNFDDCGDNSDEQNCTDGTAVGVGVGVTVAVICLILFIGIPICIFGALRRSARRRPVLRGRIVATTPASGATVVTTTHTNTATSVQPSNVAYPSQPTTFPPPPPQQPPEEYKDAQFSSGVAPPSYQDVTAYPSQYPGAAYPLAPTAPYPNQPPPQPGYPPVAQYPPQAYPPQNVAYPPPETQPYPPPTAPMT